jgi:hypothetical protein
MKWGALIGWGIVVYAIGTLVWIGLTIWGLDAAPGAQAAVYAAVAFTALVAGRSLGFSSWKDVFPYSLAWTVVSIALDALYTVPLYGWNMYHDPLAWTFYSIVLFVPLLSPSLRPSREMPRVD